MPPHGSHVVRVVSTVDGVICALADVYLIYLYRFAKMRSTGLWSMSNTRLVVLLVSPATAQCLLAETCLGAARSEEENRQEVRGLQKFLASATKASVGPNLLNLANHCLSQTLALGNQKPDPDQIINLAKNMASHKLGQHRFTNLTSFPDCSATPKNKANPNPYMYTASTYPTDTRATKNQTNS